MPPKKAAASKASPKKAAKAEGKKKKRSKKDPDAPKRGLSAYMFFVKHRRPQLVKANPALNKEIAVLGKQMGNEWAGMNDSAKAPFVKLANQDKVRYEKEKEAYNKKKMKKKRNDDDDDGSKETS